METVEWLYLTHDLNRSPDKTRWSYNIFQLGFINRTYFFTVPGVHIHCAQAAGDNKMSEQLNFQAATQMG